MQEKNRFEEVLEHIVYYFNPCKTEQLVKVLTKSFKGVDERKAVEILMAFEQNGHILLSSDGWAITKGKYLQISGDSKEENISYEKNVRLPAIENIINTQCDVELKYINCLWILIDLLPDSLEFSEMSKPFQLSFVAGGKLIQVVDIRSLGEDVKIQQLKGLPDEYDDDFKKCVSRIAIIENENHAFKVPECMGFTHVVCIDDNAKNHYRIIENRKKMGKAIW